MKLNSIVLIALSISVQALLKVELGNGSKRLIRRQFSSRNVEDVSGEWVFSGEIYIGSDEQPVNVLFDTGSYTLNVLSSDANYCTSGSSSCDYGTYDPTSSSSAVNTTSQYTVSYTDGSYGFGFYFNDTVEIAGMKVNNFKFGVVENADSDVNIAGLSLIYGDETAPTIYNFLLESGYISRRLFSTYYSPTRGKGGLVFGGLDESKYSGSLEIVPVLDDISFVVNLQKVSTDCAVINSNGYLFLLDTGSNAAELPDELWHQVHQQFNAKITSIPITGYDSDTGYNYIFRCEDAKPIYLDFSGKSVSFAPSNFLVTLYNGNSPLTDAQGSLLCSTSLVHTYDRNTTYVLGSNFLQGIFAVWDVDNAEMALADASSHDYNGEKLVEVRGSIPGASSASNYYSVYTEYTTSYNAPISTSLDLTTINTISGATSYTGTFKTSACTPSPPPPSNVSLPFFRSPPREIAAAIRAAEQRKHHIENKRYNFFSIQWFSSFRWNW